MYSPCYSPAYSGDEILNLNLDDVFVGNMDLFSNLLDVPVGLNTKEDLEVDNHCVPWMEGEVVLSKFDEDAVNFCYDGESNGQASPGSDTGISSGASPIPEVNLAFHFSDETNNRVEFGQMGHKLVRQTKKDDVMGGGLSKNAIAARENRMKKKKYVQELEGDVQRLSKENVDLKSKVGKFEGTIDNLEKEVSYLRSVLANVEELKGLVKSVRGGPCGEKLIGASLQKKRQNESNEEGSAKKPRTEENVNASRKTYETRCKRKLAAAKKPVGAGVCFHVNKGQVSLEFCSRCSVNAVERCS